VPRPVDKIYDTWHCRFEFSFNGIQDRWLYRWLYRRSSPMICTMHNSNYITFIKKRSYLRMHKKCWYTSVKIIIFRRTTVSKIVVNVFLRVTRKRAGSSWTWRISSSQLDEILAPSFDRHFMKIDAVYARALVYAGVYVIEHACSNENIRRADLAISNSVSQGACAVYNRHTKEHGHKHCWKIHARGTKKRVLVGMGKGRELRWTVPIVC